MLEDVIQVLLVAPVELSNLLGTISPTRPTDAHRLYPTYSSSEINKFQKLGMVLVIVDVKTTVLVRYDDET